MTTAELHPLVRAWADSGFEELTLSNGLRIRLRPVSPAQLITSGLLPYDLIGALVAAEEKGEQPTADVVGRATLAYLGKEQQLAAGSVRDIWNGEAWESIEIPAEVFADGRTFPPEDVEAITELAMSRIRVASSSEGVDTSDLATFRGDGSGDVDRADGGAVRAAPVAPRRSRRAAARAAAGRGDRPSPDEG